MATGKFVSIETCGEPSDKAWVFTFELCTNVGTVEAECLPSHAAIRLFHEHWSNDFDPIPNHEARQLMKETGTKLQTGKQFVTPERAIKFAGGK